MPIRCSSGETALITGGSSGIGLALARLLVERGMNVILLARRIGLLEQAKKELTPAGSDSRVEIVSADVSDLESLKRAEVQIKQTTLEIHLLINSAGVVKPNKLVDATYDDVALDLQINLQGLIQCTKTFLPFIPRGGAVVNISSAMGLFGLAGYTVYAASKFGIHGFSDALRRELLSQKITVHVVFPMEVDTPQYWQEQKDLPEWMKRDDITKPHKPEIVAQRTIKGVLRRRFLILPAFSMRVIYSLLFHVPRLALRIGDIIGPRP